MLRCNNEGCPKNAQNGFCGDEASKIVDRITSADERSNADEMAYVCLNSLDSVYPNLAEFINDLHSDLPEVEE
ncbi:MAG: hypothetical protein LBM09_00115 [Candidatus Nomurabacteria bacterium]|jgi:hypothetical protein|nr:hypothetical protein [Candidatus Nomurabacteria bacterium]